MKTAKFIIIGIAMSLMACEVADFSPYTYSNESTIYSESESTVFREILFVLMPYTEVDSQKKYLVMDSIENVALRVNDQNWGVFQSLDIDTSDIYKELANNLWISDEPLKYAVIAPFQTPGVVLSTAGDYANLLSNYLILEPGAYFCEVKSFDIKLADGSKLSIRPNIVEPILVEEETRSIFMGEFEILIKQQL